jgi:hypothetical protein
MPNKSELLPLHVGIDYGKGEDITAVCFKLDGAVQFLYGDIAKDVYNRLTNTAPPATDGEREAFEKTARDVIAVYHKTHLSKEAQLNAMVSVLQAAKASYGVPNQTDKARIEELETICAEAYQVIGAFSDFLPDAKLLDNLSQQKLVHKDVLPCVVNSSVPMGEDEITEIIYETHNKDFSDIARALLAVANITNREQPK